MKPAVTLGLVLFPCLSFLAYAQQSSPSLVLYDNFNASRIDPAKWSGTFGDTSDLREAVRELAPGPDLDDAPDSDGDRRLHLSLNSYAATSGDGGGIGGLFGLQFANPRSLTEISFTVVAKKAVAIGCATNPSGNAVTAAEFRGRFFNTELSPTSDLGDVELAIGLQRASTDAGTPLTVLAFYQRCDNAGCSARTTLDFQILGSANLGQTVKLRVKWDQPNHRFIFRMNNAVEVVSAYAVSDSFLAFFPGKTIDIAKGVPNCTTQPRPVASMDAFFDNVFVNP